MQLKRSDIIKGLTNKGFREKKEGSKKHITLEYFEETKDCYSGISTILSRGTKHREIQSTLLIEIARQCKLDRKEELRDLVKCPMSRKDYEEKLAGAGHLCRERSALPDREGGGSEA